MAIGKNNSGNIVADDFQQKLLDQAKDNLLRQQQVGDRGFLGGGASYINQAEARVNRLLPLTDALQTDSTPTNMQANNMSLQEIGKAFAEDEKNFEDEVKKEIELQKQTKFGDAMARIGGGITLSEEQRKGLSSTAREKYNQERLSARNKGIAEMLFVLSDALAGRDVIGRSMERQKARLPEEKSASKIRDELIRKIQSGAKLSADELVTLKVIDPPLAEQLLLDPDLKETITQQTSDTGFKQIDGKSVIDTGEKLDGKIIYQDQFGNRFVDSG